jgi:hypothetical protein
MITTYNTYKNPLFDSSETIIHKILKTPNNSSQLNLIIPHITAHDLNKKDNYNNHPLYIASKNHDSESIKILLPYNRETINEYNEHQKPALLGALSKITPNDIDNFFATIKLLIDAGANPSLCDKNKKNAWHYLDCLNEEIDQYRQRTIYHEHKYAVDILIKTESLLRTAQKYHKNNE